MNDLQKDVLASCYKTIRLSSVQFDIAKVASSKDFADYLVKGGRLCGIDYFRARNVLRTKIGGDL